MHAPGHAAGEPATPPPDGVAATAPGAAAVPQKKRRRRRLRWIIRLAVLAVLIGYPALVGLDCMFYYPDSVRYYEPATFHIEHEPVTFTTRDNVRLSGWFLKAKGPPRGTLVHFHGNAANISNHIVLVAWLPLDGYNVLMFDYRGYGESEGRVSRAGTIADGHAAVDYALSRSDVDPQRLYAFGQSLGGAVATVVTAERPEIRGLIAESPFASYRGIAFKHLSKTLPIGPVAGGIVNMSISAGFDPVDYVKRISPRPLLVLTAERDSICHAELGRELYEAALGPKDYVCVPELEHLEMSGEATSQKAILDFLARAEASLSTSKPAD